MENWADSDTFGNDWDTFGNDWAQFGHVWGRFFEPTKTVNIEFAGRCHFQHRFFRVPEIPLVGVEGPTHNLQWLVAEVPEDC